MLLRRYHATQQEKVEKQVADVQPAKKPVEVVKEKTRKRKKSDAE